LAQNFKEGNSTRYSFSFVNQIMQEDIKIFPPEIVKFSVEKQFAEYNPKTPVLYLILLGTFFLALILLFIIRVDISVRTTGVIKPLSERNELRSPVKWHYRFHFYY
jgi:hypothetical protein